MPRKKKELKFKFVCDKCGKLAPVDDKRSNSNYTVYKTGKCECGGHSDIELDE